MNKAVQIVSLLFSLLAISWLVVNLKISSSQSNVHDTLKFDNEQVPQELHSRITVLEETSSKFESFSVPLQNGQSLHTLMAGSGETLILMIHGADRKAQNAEYWEPFIPSLSKLGRVVAVDMLGHGNSIPGSESSIKGPFPPNQQAENLILLLNSLRKTFPELKNLVIIARSYGGRVFVEMLKNSTVIQQETLLSSLSKVVLIAPAISGSNCLSIPDSFKNLPYLVFWAQEDPVVSSNRLWELKQVFPSIQEVLLKKKDFVSVSEDISSSDWLLHTPELLLQDLFIDKIGHFLTPVSTE